jgi:purine-cytosine permease-like protein
LVQAKGEREMTNEGFVDFVLYKWLILSLEFVALYILVLLCEWFAEKKGYTIFERAWLVTLITMPIITIILLGIIFSRMKWF